MKLSSMWNEPECNSGVRVCELPNIVRGTFSEALTGDRGQARLWLPSNDRAVTGGYVAIYNVIRIVDDDDTVYEYRVVGLSDEAGGEVVEVSASSLITDLGRVLVSLTAGGVTTFDFTQPAISVTEYLNTYVFPTMSAAGLGYFALGTVDASLPAIALSWSAQTPLSLLGMIAQELNCEIWVTRNGATNYLIHVGQRTDASRPRFEVGVNVEAMQRTIIADERFITKAWPQGLTAGSDTVPSSVESALWRVGTVSGADLPLTNPSGGSDPIIGDDQFNGKTAFLAYDPLVVSHESVGIGYAANVPSVMGAGYGTGPVWDAANDCWWYGTAKPSDNSYSTYQDFVVAKIARATRVTTVYRPFTRSAGGTIFGLRSAYEQQTHINSRLVFKDNSTLDLFVFNTSTATGTKITAASIINIGGTFYSISELHNRTGDGKFVLAVVWDGGAQYHFAAISLDGGTHRDLGDATTLFGGGRQAALYYESTNQYYWLIGLGAAYAPLCWNNAWAAQVVAWGTTLGMTGSSGQTFFARNGNRLYLVRYDGQWCVVPDITSLAAQTCSNNNAITGTYDSTLSTVGVVNYPKHLPDTWVFDQPSSTAGRIYLWCTGTKNGVVGDFLQPVDVASGSNSCARVATAGIAVRLSSQVQSISNRFVWDTANSILWEGIGGFFLPSLFTAAGLTASGATSPFIKATILDTSYDNQTITLSASDPRIRAGMLLSIRSDTSGGVVQYVEHPPNIATYGLVEGRPSYRMVGRTSQLRVGTQTGEVDTAFGKVPLWASIGIQYNGATSGQYYSLVDYDAMWYKADEAAGSYAGLAFGAQALPDGSIAVDGLTPGLVIQPGDTVSFASPSAHQVFCRARTVVDGAGTATIPVTYFSVAGTIADNSAVTIIKRPLANVPAGGRAVVSNVNTGNHNNETNGRSVFFAVPIVGNASRGSYWVSAWVKSIRKSSGAGTALRLRLYRLDRTGSVAYCDEEPGTGTLPAASTTTDPLENVMSVQWQVANDPAASDHWLVIEVLNCGTTNAQSGIDGPVWIEQVIVHQGDTAHTTAIVPYGANELHSTTARALTGGRSTPTVAYTVCGPKSGLVMGATAILHDKDRGIAGASPRIVQIVRPILKNGATGTPEVTLDSRDVSLVDALLALEG